MKYYNTMVVFEEIPDEITLAINITNCPCKCPGCHSKFLWGDIGTELTFEELERLIIRNNGITCVCFMGGDSEPEYINRLAKMLSSNEKYVNLKIGWYSGRDELSDKIDVEFFDYIKIGHYDDEFGGLDKKTTNQRLYRVIHNTSSFEDITDRFWK